MTNAPGFGIMEEKKNGQKAREGRPTVRNSKKTRMLNCVCIALVLLIGPVRYFMRGAESVTSNFLIFALIAAAAVIWLSQLQRRLLRPEIRKNLIWVALLIILWMLQRTVKYEFTPKYSVAERYFWYLYYLPQTFLMLPMLFSVLQIGRPCDRPISRRWKLLYLPAAVIALGILTNDLHQLAFRFPAGLENYGEEYIHGPLYFVSIAWVFVLFVAMVTIVFHRCAVRENRKKLWMPFVPLAVGLLCFASFFVMQNDGIISLYKVPEILCFVYAAFMECLILARLLPSNDSYDDLWNASSIGAGIMARDGAIRYSAAQQSRVTPEQVRAAEHEAVLLQGGSIALRSHPIRGGYGFWTEDVSEINRLNRELAEMGDVLAEENAMLEAENKLAEDRARLEQQNRLYSGIAGSVKAQLDGISALLNDLPEDEAAFEQTMKYACILNTYVKRRSNLLLLFRQNKRLHSAELRLAISESLEYVRLYGIKTYGDFSGESVLPGELLLAAYGLFEAALEAALPETDAVFVRLQITDSALTLRMELNSPRACLAEDTMGEMIAALHGTLETALEEQTGYVCLTLPAGGEGE